MLAKDGPLTICMDFNDEGAFIGGWVSIKGGKSVKATISTPRTAGEELKLNVKRPDVVAAGHSKKALCGFVPPKGFRYQMGDFIRVTIDTDEGLSRSYSWLIGDQKDAFSCFEKIEFPRDDFSICEIPTDALLENKTSTELLKCLIIRLRRGSRGLSLSSRGGFAPYSYEFAQADFQLLERLVSEYSFAVLDLLGESMRWLFSLNDTFSDWSTGACRSTSVYIGSFMMWERSAQTLLKSKGALFDLTNVRNAPGQRHSWGQMGTHQLSSDDSFDVYLARSWDLIRTSRLWLHFELLRRMFIHPQSLHGIILDYSDYAKESWAIYENKTLSARNQLMWTAGFASD